MCIGTPLQVVDCEGVYAICEARGQRERLDMQIVGKQPPGTWVLAFHGTARRVITENEARRIRDALAALQVALSSDGEVAPAALDHLFADIVEREPQLPAHLRKTA